MYWKNAIRNMTALDLMQAEEKQNISNILAYNL